MVEAIRGLVNGKVEGNHVGSSTLFFQPGREAVRESYTWDIGSAGSTILLAEALLPLLAFHRHEATIQVRGGIFQDFAPSFYHLKFSLLPLLRRMGLPAEARLLRPGYVPLGQGVIELDIGRLDARLKPLVLGDRGEIQRIWGIALASRLKERKVAQRMAGAARDFMYQHGMTAEIDEVDEETAAQPGAAFAMFAEVASGTCLGSDRSGAPRRMAEAVGRHAARVLLEDVATGASVDRFTADQLIPFAALAEGESRWSVPRITGHIEAGAWLVKELLGADVLVSEDGVTVRGVGFKPGR